MRQFQFGDAVRVKTHPHIRGNVCVTSTARNGVTHYVRIKTADAISFAIREAHIESDPCIEVAS